MCFKTHKEALQFGNKIFEDVQEKYPERVKDCIMEIVNYEEAKAY